MSFAPRALPILLFAFLCTMCNFAPASAGDNGKSARGIVTSIGSGSISINLPSDTDVRFLLDSNTCVVARGAGRKMRKAQEQGASGVKLAEVVPIGASVEVRYEERDGKRYATRIVTMASAPR